MTLFNFNKSSEEEKNKPKADANKQPLWDPKRILQSSKPVAHSGDGDRRSASIFRLRPASPADATKQSGATLAVEVEARADKSRKPGDLSISVPVSVTLHAGTNLPIALNMSVPVQATIPVTLQVPIKISLTQTESHQPFTALQDTTHVDYRLIDRNAQYPQGIFFCKDLDSHTTMHGIL